MRDFTITEHVGRPPSPREIAIERNAEGKASMLAEFYWLTKELERLDRERVPFWQIRSGYIDRRRAKMQAALADAPGGRRCGR